MNPLPKNMILILLFTIVSLTSSILALILYRLPRIQTLSVFILTGLSGFLATCTGATVLFSSQPLSYTINSTLPSLTWQLNLNPLSSFFLIIIGIIVISISCYGPEYVSNDHDKQPTSALTTMYFFTGLFISSMYLVLLAADVITFMLAWELMSISSYFLVIHNHEQHANRQAALIYLLMAQTSGLLILFAFGILIKISGSFSFALWHNILLPPNMAHLAFFLAFLGFGMKAGVVPLHIWLPKAHPVAPSHISALMSGVMLKVAVYGLIGFTFNLLPNIQWQWGTITLFIGTISAIFGILYALMQHDLKKLLAYSSVENIGIIFSTLGLALIFISTKHTLLATLSLIAALYHCLNHAIFKSLLFLGAGIIIKYSHEHDLEHMGGLIKKMPHTAWYFLIGCISISALPPFNGFISEWLFLQTAIQAPILKSEIMRSLIPVAAAIIALTSALAAACFVKVYGVAFLGQARSANMQKACDPKLGVKFAMGFLALLCLLFGVLPNFIIVALNNITQQLIGAKLISSQSLLWLIPLHPKTSSYNAVAICFGIIITCAIVYFLLRFYYGQTKSQKIQPWDCGYGGINQKMQYSAAAFAMPIRRIFHHLFLPQEKIEKSTQGINYGLQIKDLILQYIYAPLEQLSTKLVKILARLQGGNVRVYLTYIFITLILLLWTIA